ncbi:MAG: folylpolyglutamate synthase/dihydrofolate synthase family protein [Candidatus Micrarchaeia archaeon]
MVDEYQNALAKLHSISMFGSKPGLERIRTLLFNLGNPQNDLKCILVGGTNGKGSCTSFLSDILIDSKYKTGSFFSPHIFSFRERIQINAKFISKSDFALLLDEVLSASKSLEQKPTFFETITAMAFLCFSKNKCDYAVLEVGMGGRLDATNICNPILSIIASISLEHTQHLGNTLEKIAFEKGGIMRKGSPVVCGADSFAQSELEKIAHEKGAIFYPINKKYLDINIRASGTFQKKNAALCATAASLLKISDEKIINALSHSSIRARWEKISSSPDIIIDCAHNPRAAQELVFDLKKDFSAKEKSSRILLFAAMKDKDYTSVLEKILPYFDSAIFCTPPMQRAQDAAVLASAAKKISPSLETHSFQDAKEAFAFAKKTSGKNGRILCAGSIYLLQYLFGEDEFCISG